ncbi:uncharacterized protein LOC106160570 [Lingula anatina]|uniref:Uncharacterized protein LOC106160570 n=1 Tax=Lingula anatina TaxID=7574 RepID=A0A1S3I5L7_LINAN|nr:uncharacterized protein LOC106160570 [Lingula anatina]|eukprot:XP_013392664.1 uncharacterized protein LOC106160570 [Lingula anatina]
MYAKSEARDTGKPFGLQWMDSSYQETLLTNSPWMKVEELLNKGLADKILRQIDHADRREMIFQLLGPEFVQKHFSDYEQDAAVLDPPAMSKHERDKLQKEAQSWLQNQLKKTASETRCHRPRAGEEAEEEPCPEMIEFLTHTYQLFSKGLEREMYLQEKELTQKKLDDLTQKKAQAPANTLPSKVSSLFHPLSANSDSTIHSEKPSTSNIKANLHKVSGEPPTFWGPQSDLMGTALIATLKRDPRRFEEVSRRLHGRQLPGGLRCYMWIDVLFRAERQKMKDLNVEKIVRERFGKAVARGVGELRIKRATHSPINGLIENAVIEIYETTPSMMPFNYELHLKESARSLNVLYVYDRRYEPYLVHWLFPMQIAFREQNHQVLAEHIYELAMYLDLFSQSCFPKWPEVFAVAEKVMDALLNVDAELHDHLRTVAFKNVKVNPKEFLVQLLHLEQTKAKELAAATPRSGNQSQASKDLLADPLIFLRKWIGEGFVSVLDTQAVLLIWDQCFMQGWGSSVLHDVCLALLLLLKHKFMEATDYHSMKKVEKGKMILLFRNVEKIVRERFGKAVARGVGELRIKRATHSPINGLIENAVIEIYETTPSMMPFNYELHLKESARSLNVLYVYDRRYEPYLVHWLFPMQIAFREQNHQVLAEHIYELAMYLDLFSQSCFPKWPEVFAVAEKVMDALLNVDAELHDHLRTVAFKNVKVNPKEFLVQLLHLEQTKAKELAAATPRSGNQSQASKDLLADPLIFLRKWIGEGFVSVLDTQAVLLIWDQCFMQGWGSSVLHDVCLALLLLLKHKFMEATDYHSMKKVFLKEPCKLYTVDIQRAWIHLQNGGNAEDVPYMNRQRPQSPGPVVKSAPSRVVRSPSPSTTSVVPLPPVGIKHIRIKLIFSADVQDRVEWLADFDPSAIKVLAGVFFGTIRISARWSRTLPTCRGVTADKYGSKVYTIDLLQEKFEFVDMDATNLDVEREMGGFPYAVVRVEYDAPGSSNGNSRVSLGWSRIPLFQHSSQDSQSLPHLWELLEGEYSYTLYSGPVSESILNGQPRTPLPSHQDLLADNCELSAMVYDPTMAVDTPASKTGTPITREPTPPGFQPWVPFNPHAAEIDPAPTGLNEPFTLFIDGVNFIPDNATIIKVTGRVLKTGNVTNIPDILAFPALTSPARCPKFKFGLHVNENGDEIDPGVVALLRVYTVDTVTGELVVIGSCLVGIFDDQSQLLVGGQQLRLRSGMPDLRSGLAGLKVTDLDNAPCVPGASLLIRILPGLQDDSDAPDYQTGYYRSESCEPYMSEERIFDSYMKDKSFDRNVNDIARLLLEKEEDELEDNSTRSLSEWIESRLDNKVHLPPKQPANSLDLMRCVKYRINVGLSVRVSQAFGLPEGLFVECFGLVVPGATTKDMEPTEEGFGHPNYKFVTLTHDYDSLQKAPIWLDEPKVVHPYYDPNAILLLQVFTMNAVYKPTADHKSPGQVVDKSGGQLSLDSVLGWSVVQLFEGGSVLCGEHHVPLFKGKPPQDLLTLFEDSPVEEVLKQQKWNNSNKYQSSQLVIRMWDAHYDITEHPPVSLHENLLEAVGNIEAYQKVADDKRGKMISQMVVDSLERKYKKLGTNSSVYDTERQFFEQVMNETFYNLIENTLMGAGYGPL